MLLLRTVWNSLMKNPLRASLTLISISLGVAVMTLVFNISFRMQDYVRYQILGKGCRFTIGNVSRERSVWSWQVPPVFRSQDAAFLKKDYPGLKYISPIVWHDWQWVQKGDSLYKSVMGILGVGPEYAAIANLKLINGSFISPDDITSNNQVTVISEPAAKFLFGDVNTAIGQTLTVNQARPVAHYVGSSYYTSTEYQVQNYKVVGVFAAVPVWHRIIYDIRDFYIPYTLQWNNELQPLSFMAWSDLMDFPSIRAAVDRSLHQLHGPDTLVAVWEGDLGNSGNFEVFQRSVFWVSVSLGIVGMIALLISSFGVFSITMVGILERAREIGLRRALGSSRRGILLHFLCEAGLLSLGGALIGLGIAMLFNPQLIKGLLPFLEGFDHSQQIVISRTLDLRAIAYSLGAILLSGAVLGMIPAITASQVPPVESLRES